MIVAITGHRSEKIPVPGHVKTELRKAFSDLGVTKVIQGMAAGVDLWSAQVAYAMDIPYVCAKPWAGHKPRVADRSFYESVLEHASEIVDVDPSQDYPGPWVYQKRNEWMVDNADYVVAVWDGSSGGTKNCVDYAVKKLKRMLVLSPAKSNGAS